MKTSQIPAFPLIIQQVESGQFISYDEEGIVGHELVDRPEEATIFPMLENEPLPEERKREILDILDELKEEFGKCRPLSVKISVEIPS